MSQGIRGGVRVEEVLLFEGETKEKVDGYTRMLEEMWAERGRLIESRPRNILRNDEQERKGEKFATLQSQDRRTHHYLHIV